MIQYFHYVPGDNDELQTDFVQNFLMSPNWINSRRELN